ncbi:hypothetical protein K439DRAFT_1136264 [Ramaria rubella]|nr:hypothetical protein K439DRAFT_1136264 [Ramaria rubella]
MTSSTYTRATDMYPYRNTTYPQHPQQGHWYMVPHDNTVDMFATQLAHTLLISVEQI